MLKGINKKLNHIVLAFGLKGILLIALGVWILVDARVLVWGIVIFIFLAGFTSLFIAFKIEHIKSSTLGKISNIFRR